VQFDHEEPVVVIVVAPSFAAVPEPFHDPNV
jgi:hypothetical protein